MKHLEKFITQRSPLNFFCESAKNPPVVCIKAKAFSSAYRVYVREMFMHQLEFGSKIASISFDLLARMIYRTNDFYSTFNWNVKTWVPLVSKLLPHDTTIIYKYGQCVRIDTRYRYDIFGAVLWPRLWCCDYGVRSKSRQLLFHTGQKVDKHYINQSESRAESKF